MQLNLNMTPEELKALKISFDENSDGLITFGEIESSLNIMVESKIDQIIENKKILYAPKGEILNKGHCMAKLSDASY